MTKFTPPLLLLALAAGAADRDPVAQVMDEALRAHHSDERTARNLSFVEPRRRLGEKELTAWLKDAPGPRTRDTLELIATASAFLAPESASEAAPSSDEQARLLARARAYAAQYVQSLPDFLCARATRHFDDFSDLVRRPAVWNRLRLRDVEVGELSYTKAGERYAGPRNKAATSLDSYGEFGAILLALLAGSARPEVEWSHWEPRRGRRLAVFRYAVPVERSQYSVGYCCGADKQPVSVITAYRGELQLDPDSGVVRRVTRVAVDLPRNFVTLRAETVIDYDPVPVGPPGLLLPSRSVTLSTSWVQTLRGRARVNYLNDIRFLRYRKFGATSRLAGDDAPEPVVETDVWLEPAPEEEPPSPAAAAAPAAGGRPMEVTVLVRDRSGAPVTGLTRESFTVLDNGVPRPVSRLEPAQKPGPLVLLLDRDSAEWPVQSYASLEVSKLLQTPGAPALIVYDFGGREDASGAPRWPHLPPAQLMVPRRDEAASMWGEFFTRLSALPGRKIVVWLAADLPSGAAEREGLIRGFQGANAAVYPLGGDAPASDFALRTGGRVSVNTSDLAGVLQAAVADSRSAYRLTFAAGSATPDGAWHDLRVTLPTLPDLRVRSARGFQDRPTPAAAQRR